MCPPPSGAARALQAVPDVAPASSSERAVYLRIFAHSQDSVYLVDPASHAILFANPRAAEDTSYEAEELETLKFTDLFLDDDKAAIRTLLETTLQWKTGVDPQRALRRKTGRKLTTEISTSIVQLDGHPAIFCNVRDITARVKAENEIRKMNAELEDRVKARTAELAAQKQELEDVMNHIQQAIVTINPEGKLNSEHSRHVKTVFGEERPIGGASIAEFLFAGEEIEKTGAIVRDTLLMSFGAPDNWDMLKDLLPREVLLRERDLELEWVPILTHTEDGTLQLPKVMLIVLDVTEQKRLKAEIARAESQHAEQLEMISRMLSMPAATVEQFLSDQKRFVAEMEQVLTENTQGLGLDALQALFRCVHTLKGSAAQFQLNSIRDKGHALEERLATQVDRERMAVVVRKRRAELETAYNEAARHPGSEALQQRIADLLQVRFPDTLLDTGAQAFAQGAREDINALAASIQEMQAFAERIFKNGASSPTASAASGSGMSQWLMSRLESALQAGRPELESLAQVPVRFLWDRLESLAQSTARELGRTIEIERRGDSVEIDYRHIAPLYDGLLHAVRNSLDHGYESPEERAACGKTGPVKLKMEAQARGGAKPALFLTVGDDGKGVDLSRVRAKAGAKAQGLDDQATLQLIFESGLSTRDQVTELSGRGVGLDQLRAVVSQKLHGDVQAHSELGKGTRFEISLPLENREQSHGLAAYLRAGSTIQSQRITVYEKKNEIIEALADWARTLPAFSELASVLGTIADEMIMNGMFDAPRTPDGKEKYNQLPRTHPLVLEESEAVTFRYGADSRWVGISIEDPFGALNWETIIKHLAKGMTRDASGTKQLESRSGGAGLGLFTIMDNAHSMVVEVKPGKRTEVIALIGLSRSFAQYQTARRTLSFCELAE